MKIILSIILTLTPLMSNRYLYNLNNINEKELNINSPKDAQKFTNSIGMLFVKIASGSFIMGRDITFEDGAKDQLPLHKVYIKSFYLASTEVTQSQWVEIMGKNNPSNFKARNNPVENVSYNDARKFIQKLNKKEHTNKYRLPSESEWEYSAKAGTNTKWSFGDEKKNLDQYAWFDKSSGNKAHPVGNKKPNKWGLYDMHGNVWEWCEDWYVSNYKNTPRNERANNSGNKTHKVLRGGSWLNYGKFTKSVVRFNNKPNKKYINIGFRLAKNK